MRLADHPDRDVPGEDRPAGWRSQRIIDLFRRRSDPFDRGRSLREGLGDWFERQWTVEASARTAFYVPVLGLLVGTAFLFGIGLRLPVALVAGCVALALLVVLVSRSFPSLRMAALFALAASSGLLLGEMELRRTVTTVFSGEATVRIEGRVAWRDVDERGRFRYLVRIERTERPVLSRPPDRVRLVVSSRHEPIGIGGTYRGLVRLRAPSGPVMPGAYDFAFTPFFQGLGAYGYSLGAPEPAPAVDPSALSFTERVAALRVRMAERIRSTVEGAEGAVASALIAGERAGIPDEVEEWLRVTGLAHVLSISGFHMALVAGFTMLSVRALAAAVPGLPLVLSTKKIAAAAALVVSSAYLLIAGENVATTRSYIMLVIMLGAVLLDRPALTLRNVAIAAVIVLVMTPHAVVTASFQMSFAATAALVGAYGALMRRWQVGSDEEGRSRPLRRGLVAGALVAVAGMALSSMIAGGATAPFGAYHFQRAATVGGVVANVLAMPLFSFWIMPLALLAVLLMPLGLDAPLLQLLGLGLSLVFEMAEWLAALFPDHATGRISLFALALFSAAILAFCFLASGLRWFGVPLVLVGLAVAKPSAAPPELLVFEDGKEVALIDDRGRLTHLRERPSDFVAEQWTRAFPSPTDQDGQPRPDEVSAGATEAELSTAASFQQIERQAHTGTDPEHGSATEAHGFPSAEGHGFVCDSGVCRAVTRTGLRIAWTEDFERTGLLCDSSDVAIVSRAIRLTECRSGAELVTLRTLRRTGSVAVSRDSETGEPLVTPSVGTRPEEWNRHRHAPWPEYWINPDRPSADGEPVRDGSSASIGPTPSEPSVIDYRRPAGPAAIDYTNVDVARPLGPSPQRSSVDGAP